MRIVGLISSYLEGDLLAGAMRSIDRVGLDDLLVFEGPAGEPLEADVPASVFRRDVAHVAKHGRWRTDARKRNEMLAEAKRRHPTGPVWGVWLDGDEILVNGEYLRDQLQAVIWNDEHDGSDQPTNHWPIRLIEADGSMSIAVSRLFRIDLTHSIDISAATITNLHGIEEAWGNVHEDSRIWLEMWMRAIDMGKMAAWPPLPCEPHIFHRSHLRHPLRRGNRLHKQEAAELRKAGKL